ncbi:MAG: peptidylprolyl isomerase, partial [Pseudomonadota bacterium]
NESRYSISNSRGTVAMARTSIPDSATSQFYVNQTNNGAALNFGTANAPDGFTVFAVLSSGLDVVDAIAAIPTAPALGIGNDVPTRTVVIRSATVSD